MNRREVAKSACSNEQRCKKRITIIPSQKQQGSSQTTKLKIFQVSKQGPTIKSLKVIKWIKQNRFQMIIAVKSQLPLFKSSLFQELPPPTMKKLLLLTILTHLLMMRGKNRVLQDCIPKNLQIKFKIELPRKSPVVKKDQSMKSASSAKRNLLTPMKRNLLLKL